MLMIACEYTDCIIISQFSVRGWWRAGQGELGRARRKSIFKTWRAELGTEAHSDQEGDSGTDRTNRRQAPSNHEGVCTHPLVT